MLPHRWGPSASPALRPGWRPEVTASLLHRQVVEELLSGNPHIEKESVRSIADGAMMEAASVCVGRMVRAAGSGPPDPPSPCPCPPRRAVPRY